MPVNRKTTVLALTCLLPLALGMRALVSQLDVQPESRLLVRGTSSVRAWECRATSFGATVEATTPEAAAAVLNGDKAVGGADVKVAIEKLECGNGTMNGHMRKALKAVEFPVISFHLATYELAKTAEGIEVDLQGQLTMGGVEKPVIIKGMATAGEGGALRVGGTYELKMTDFGLKPPSLMFGTMKVGDLVKVTFDVILKDRA